MLSYCHILQMYFQTMRNSIANTRNEIVIVKTKGSITIPNIKLFITVATIMYKTAIRHSESNIRAWNTLHFLFLCWFYTMPTVTGTHSDTLRSISVLHLQCFFFFFFWHCAFQHEGSQQPVRLTISHHNILRLYLIFLDLYPQI